MSLGTPDLHVSSKSQVKGTGTIEITRRKDAQNTGLAQLKIAAVFDPATNDYPTGSIALKVSWSDSLATEVRATSIEQINSWGKHTPTVVLTGRCEVSARGEKRGAKGCRYWLLIADNTREPGRSTPDIVSLLVFDRNGTRIIYGTGPVIRGDFVVAASTN